MRNGCHIRRTLSLTFAAPVSVHGTEAGKFVRKPNSSYGGNMKRIVSLLIIVVVFGFAPVLHAQDHGQIGAFGDYYWLNATHTSFGGLGARVSASAWKYIQL